MTGRCGRRCCALLLAALAIPASASAQLRLGVHASTVTAMDDFFPVNGDWGLGGLVGFEGGRVPVGLYAEGTLVVPDGGLETFASARAALLVRLRLPSDPAPYVLAGLQYRTEGIAGIDEPSSGAVVGMGVRYRKVFFEVQIESNGDESYGADLDNDPVLFELGVLLW